MSVIMKDGAILLMLALPLFTWRYRTKRFSVLVPQILIVAQTSLFIWHIATHNGGGAIGALWPLVALIYALVGLALVLLSFVRLLRVQLVLLVMVPQVWALWFPSSPFE
jgi:hypothetical protein